MLSQKEDGIVAVWGILTEDATGHEGRRGLTFYKNESFPEAEKQLRKRKHPWKATAENFQ